MREPTVAECRMLAGGFDYLVKVRFDDIENFRRVLERIVKFPGVNQTHTFMVIEQVKVDSTLLLTNYRSLTN